MFFKLANFHTAFFQAHYWALGYKSSPILTASLSVSFEIKEALDAGLTLFKSGDVIGQIEIFSIFSHIDRRGYAVQLLKFYTKILDILNSYFCTYLIDV